MKFMTIASWGPRKGKVLRQLDWVRMDLDNRVLLCNTREQAQDILRIYRRTHHITEANLVYPGKEQDHEILD